MVLAFRDLLDWDQPMKFCRSSIESGQAMGEGLVLLKAR